jgi:hypothetical protein
MVDQADLEMGGDMGDGVDGVDGVNGDDEDATSFGQVQNYVTSETYQIASEA